MDILVFEGRKGSGMTLSAVAFAYEVCLKEKKPLCSGILPGQGYNYFTEEDFLEMQVEE